jgi:hypothetical protein
VFANIAKPRLPIKGIDMILARFALTIYPYSFVLNAGWFRKPDGIFMSIVGASSTRRHANKEAETA